MWHRAFVCVKRAIHLIRVFTPFLAVTLIVSWTSDQSWRDYWLNMMIATLESAGCSFMKFGQWLSMRPDLLPSLVSSLADCRLTHACLTKLDELHDDRAVADLAARLTWPMRWVTTGQAVPNDLHPAKAAILGALGLPTVTSRSAAA